MTEYQDTVESQDATATRRGSRQADGGLATDTTPATPRLPSLSTSVTSVTTNRVVSRLSRRGFIEIFVGILESIVQPAYEARRLGEAAAFLDPTAARRVDPLTSDDPALLSVLWRPPARTTPRRPPFSTRILHNDFLKMGSAAAVERPSHTQQPHRAYGYKPSDETATRLLILVVN